MSSPLPQVQTLIGFSNNPFDDHSAWTVAAPGVLGGAGVWTDISSDVEYVDYGRGRQHELNTCPPGTANIILKNNIDVGQYSPWNTLSPYNGFILPLKKVQIRYIWNAVTYKRYTGYVIAWPIKWPDGVSQEAEIRCEDAFRIFNLTLLASNSYSAQVLADGAGNYWRCNELVNATGLADSGPSNQPMVWKFDSTGTQTPITGGPSPLMLQSDGGSVSFGGYTGSGSNTHPYAQGSGALGVGGGGAFSVETWVNVPQYGSGSNINPNTGPSIMGQSNGGAMADSWLMMISFGQARFDIRNSAGNIFSVNSAGPVVADGQWHHIVATFDASNLRLYVDGAQVGATTAVTLPVNFNAADTVQLAAYWSGSVNNLGGLSMAETAIYRTTQLSLAQITNHYQLGIGFPTQNSSTRIRSTAVNLGWPVALSPGVGFGVQSVARPYTSLAKTSALQHFQTVELSEGGAVFMDGAGALVFLSRQSIATDPTHANVQATFGDQAADIAFAPGCDLAFDDQDIINQCICTNVGSPVYQPKTQIVNDSASQTSYRLRSKSMSGLLHLSDNAALQHATWIVNKLKTPVTRLRLIEIDMINILSSTSKVASVLALDLLYRVLVERVQVSFTQTALIERIEERIGPDTWIIRFALSPTDTYATYSWGGAQ